MLIAHSHFPRTLISEGVGCVLRLLVVDDVEGG